MSEGHYCCTHPTSTVTVRPPLTVENCDDCNRILDRSLKCGCGRRVHLTGSRSDTYPCDCGADYNGSGQRLAPREQWGEETGEHPADIYLASHAELDSDHFGW